MKQRIVFLAALIFATTFVFGQGIITIIEKDRDGRFLGEDGNPKDDYKNNKIVDINSVLQIKLDKDPLIQKVGETYQMKMPHEITERLSKLKKYLSERDVMLANTYKLLGEYDYESFKNNSNSYKNWITKLQELSDKYVKLLKEDPRILQVYLYKYGDEDEAYEGAYKAAIDVMQELEMEIVEFTQEKGMYIQFGGWLHRKDGDMPIHLQGFDDIAPQEPYEVERWQFLPTDEQLKELEKIQEFAKKNRDTGLKVLKESIDNQKEVLTSIISEKVNELLIKLKFEIENVKSSAKGAIDPKLLDLFTSIEQLERSLEKFRSELAVRLDYYSKISSDNEFQLTSFLSHSKEDINFIINDDGKALVNTFNEIVKKTNNLSGALATTATNIKTLVSDLQKDYTKRYEDIKEQANTIFQEILMGQKFDIAALQFSSDVYKLALTDVPEKTELDLIYTGVRNEGDRLGFKLTISEKEDKKTTILDSKEIYMFKVLPHVETSVGVIFADPFTSTNISTQFQMAPCYNILFKGFWDQGKRRKSVVYNRLFEWGWGLHISTPDFDKDDVPELGFGVVISLLSDYFQVGSAYNVFEGAPYWFFGMKIPIPSFGISSNGKNSGLSSE